MKPLHVDAYRLALREAIERSFEFGVEQMGRAQIYGYTLFLHQLGSGISAIVQTEDGLQRIVQRYIGAGWKVKAGQVADVMKTYFRWEFNEDWLILEDPYFKKANEVIYECWSLDCDAFYEDGNTRLVQITSLVTLAELDAAGFFGRGKDRQGIVLNRHLCGGMSDDETLAVVDLVNPYEVSNRFRAEYQTACSHRRNVHSGR